MSLGKVEILTTPIESIPELKALRFDPVPTRELLELTIDEPEGRTSLAAAEIRTATMVVFVEPATTAAVLWVLGAIAAGMLQWVGGRIMQSLFGTKGPDLEDLLWQLLVDFQKIVRVELQAEAQRKAAAGVQGLKDTMEGYAQDPNSPARIATLPIMVTEADNLYAELESLGLPATGAIGLAATLKLAVLVELYFLAEKSPGEARNCKSLYQRYSTHVENMHEELVRTTPLRFSRVHSIGIPIPNSNPIHQSFYYLDGKVVPARKPKSRLDVEKQRAQHIVDETLSQVSKVIVPARAIADEIGRVVDSL